MNVNVTIIADASYCPLTGAAGYAFWIASTRGKLGGSGGMKDRVVNNIAAEMMALLNGLHQACKKGLVQVGDNVLLQTDCQSAIDAFNEQRRNITTEELSLVVYLRKLITVMHITVRFKHVKGHTAGLDERTFTNNKCDYLAGIAMKEARTKLLRKKNE